MSTDSAIRLLVVDDDPGMLAVLECGLQQQPGFSVRAVGNAAQALMELKRGGWDLFISDYALGDESINGIDLLREARKLDPAPLTIIITAFASLQITLESIKLGAHNFLTKPFQMDELYLVARNAATAIRLTRENRDLREQAAEVARALEAIERQHLQLLDRIRRLEYEGSETENPEDTPVTALNTTQAMELRRRRMRDQVAAYRLAGESLERQVVERREQLQGVLKTELDG